MKPIFEGAPGHIVRRAGNKWEVRWQARTDLVSRGFTPKSERIWIGDTPTDMERAHVADRCRRLQDEMLLYSRGGLPTPTISHVFDGTLRSLINCYQTDPDSRYHKKQYAVRRNFRLLAEARRYHGDNRQPGGMGPGLSEATARQSLCAVDRHFSRAATWTHQHRPTRSAGLDYNWWRERPRSASTGHGCRSLVAGSMRPQRHHLPP